MLILKGNITLVSDLIAQGKNMYALDIHENSSVYYACLVGDCDILTMLFDKGYEVYIFVVVCVFNGYL